MRKTICTAAAVVLLLPLTCIASEIDFPELGIALKGLPELAAKPVTTERPQGYEASARFADSTTLTIYRQDEPVSAGSLDDLSYRSTVLAQLGAPQDWKDKGKAASVGGREAWITLHEVRLGPVSIERITLYTVADEHVYRVFVTATGSKPPAGSDAVVKAVQSSTVFAPVRRTLEPEWAASDHPERMPRFVPGEVVPLYPDTSRRRSEQGAVDVEFSIDAHGHATEIKQVRAAYHDLGERIPGYFTRGIFRVPRDWQQTGSDKRRFNEEFRFMLATPGVDCADAVDAREKAHNVVYVCAPAVPGK